MSGSPYRQRQRGPNGWLDEEEPWQPPELTGLGRFVDTPDRLTVRATDIDPHGRSPHARTLLPPACCKCAKAGGKASIG